jgi:cell wall-associated NlpC family hydrolase
VHQWLCVPYKYGGQSKNGVDCSGLVVEIYKNVYGIKLYRASYEIYEKNCSKINCEELEEGDLVFFNTHKKNNRINHVGLYLKNDKFVHSSTSKGVIISDMTEPYYKKCFVGAGRVKKD